MEATVAIKKPRKFWTPSIAMPLHPLQKRVLKLLQENRNPESYLSGGTMLNRSETSPRYSKDLDIFHDSVQEVELAALKDEETLRSNQFTVEWKLRRPGFFRAVAIESSGERVLIEWAQDSNFRFFPLVKDEEVGYRLHDADLATNKILALAGRQTARDFLDALFLHQGYLSLGALIWAASGKDPGLSPEFILNEAKRENRFNQEALEAATEQLDLAVPIDVVQTKETWLKACEEAEALFATLPLNDVGCLYLDKHGKPRTPGNVSGLTPHFASPKGTVPRVMAVPPMA